MKFIPLILRNLMRNRRRTILSLLSIAISMFIFAALMSLPSVVSQLLRDRVSALRLDCAAKGGFGGFDYTLPASYGETIRTMPHVDAVSGALFLLANYRNPGEMMAVAGIDPAQLRALFPDWGIAPDDEVALEHSRSSALVSAALAKRFKWKIGEKVIFHGINLPADIDFTVAGVLGGDHAPDSIVIVPFERLNQMEGNPGRVVVFFIRIDRTDSAAAVIQEIDSRFANSAYETSTQTELGVAQMRIRMLRLLFVGVQIIASIIVLVIALVAANTAAMSVRERRHELAVMRALGFTRRFLIGSIAMEGMLIGTVSGAIGALLAYEALRILGASIIFAGRLILHLTAAVAIESVAIAAAIGLLSAALPALTATRHDIAQALRATV